MFLQKVKFKQFVESAKGSPKRPDGSTRAGRHLRYRENPNPDDVYHIIGKTHMVEGVSEWVGYEEGYTFRFEKRHEVYIVAKSIGRRFKVLVDDVEFVQD